MKAQDLMIGDWIAENIDEEGCDFLCCWVSHQVNADDFKFWDENDWIDVDDKCFSEFWRPIPLTPEILEKNGFSGAMYAVCQVDEERQLQFYYHEHRLKVYYEGIDEYYNHQKVTDETFRCHCHYVHELQHALRLCGIEKEIEL